MCKSHPDIRGLLLLSLAGLLIISACSSGTPDPSPLSETALDPDQAEVRQAPQRRRPPPPPEPPGYQHIQIPSSADGSMQDVALIVPVRELADPLALVVYLHGWSASWTDRRPSIEAEAENRGWLLAIPDFRGPYANHCGNELAQQDILDVVVWAKANYPVDESRVYLTGFSGGGFMAMLMAARYPDVWAAVSAWSGFGDLTNQYDYTVVQEQTRYTEGFEACLGGNPNTVAAANQNSMERSPNVYFEQNVPLPPLDINAQKDDPLVPVRQSMLTFQAIAPELITDEEIGSLYRDGPLPPAARIGYDPLSERDIYLRRQMGDVRLTIRPGRHEILGTPAFDWFDRYPRPSE